MDRDTTIKKEISRLQKIFANISKDKKSLVKHLIESAAFMYYDLTILQECIATDGPITKGTNGNGFEVVQEHPAQKSYNTTVKNYMAIIRQLSDLLPDTKADTVTKAGESLAAFVAKGKPVIR